MNSGLIEEDEENYDMNEKMCWLWISVCEEWKNSSFGMGLCPELNNNTVKDNAKEIVINANAQKEVNGMFII